MALRLAVERRDCSSLVEEMRHRIGEARQLREFLQRLMDRIGRCGWRARLRTIPHIPRQPPDVNLSARWPDNPYQSRSSAEPPVRALGQLLPLLSWRSDLDHQIGHETNGASACSVIACLRP